MKSNSFVLSTTIPVTANKLYEAFLDSEIHSQFTSSPAKIENKIGGRFTAWDGYISGVTTHLEKDKKIVQKWRTTDFDSSNADSLLEIEFVEENGKTKLTLKHSNLPEGTAEEYKQGWKDYYFKPLKEYFSK